MAKSGKPNIVVSNFVDVPEMPPESERDPTTLYVVPQRVPERDQSLGRFMGKWSGLEQTLQSLTHTLMGGPYSAVGVVFHNCSGIRQIMELISGLGELNLTQSEFGQLSSLLERLKKKNTKRNRIVHGVWVPEMTIGSDDQNRPIVAKYVWARVYTPTSPAEQKKTTDIKNPAARSKYRFTIEEIDEVAPRSNDASPRFWQVSKSGLKTTAPRRTEYAVAAAIRCAMIIEIIQ